MCVWSYFNPSTPPSPSIHPSIPLSLLQPYPFFHSFLLSLHLTPSLHPSLSPPHRLYTPANPVSPLYHCTSPVFVFQSGSGLSVWSSEREENTSGRERGAGSSWGGGMESVCETVFSVGTLGPDVCISFIRKDAPPQTHTVCVLCVCAALVCCVCVCVCSY